MQNLKKYLLEKITKVQSKKSEKGIVPNHVGGLALKDMVIDDVREALIDLVEADVVEMGKEVNDIYFKLKDHEGKIEI